MCVMWSALLNVSIKWSRRLQCTSFSGPTKTRLSYTLSHCHVSHFQGGLSPRKACLRAVMYGSLCAHRTNQRHRKAASMSTPTTRWSVCMQRWVCDLRPVQDTWGHTRARVLDSHNHTNVLVPYLPTEQPEHNLDILVSPSHKPMLFLVVFI